MLSKEQGGTCDYPSPKSNLQKSKVFLPADAKLMFWLFLS